MKGRVGGGFGDQSCSATEVRVHAGKSIYFIFFCVALLINNLVVVRSLRNTASETKLGCKSVFDLSLPGRGPVESCEPSCPQLPLFTRSCAGPCFGSVPTKHPAGPRREDCGQCRCTWRTETMLRFRVEHDIPRPKVSTCDAGGRL